jgi:hypothetical protein
MTTDTITDRLTTLTREPAPSAVYDGARTAAEVDDIYRNIWATNPPTTSDEHWAILEDHRRAHVRVARPDAVRTIRAPRGNRSQKAEVAVTDDGALVITCRVCGETKPERKFPTLSGRPGRADRCRDCRDAAKNKS